MTNSKRKKILFFLPSAVGGAERVTINIASLLDDEIYEKEFVIIGWNANDMKNVLPKDCKTHRIIIRNPHVWGILRILIFIMLIKPDVVFSSLFFVNVRLLLASKILGVPAVVRNNYPISKQTKRMQRFVGWTYRFAKKIIVQQEEMYEEFLTYYPGLISKTQVLHNPFLPERIDLLKGEDNPYPPEKQINYLWVARFSHEKGHDILMDSFVILANKIPNAHLYVVGKYTEDNPLYMYVKNKVFKENLTDRVHLVGFDKNPYKWVNYCDCFVMPSRMEGLPNALVEAMYLHKPVVASRCIPIVSRMVKDGYNGYTVEVGDVNDMAEKMIAAINLHNFEMIYKPADANDVTEIFS